MSIGIGAIEGSKLLSAMMMFGAGLVLVGAEQAHAALDRDAGDVQEGSVGALLQQQNVWQQQESEPLLLAQSARERRRQAAASRRKRSGGGLGRGNDVARENTTTDGTRRRVMVSEKQVTMKRGMRGQTNIDFEEIDITGQRRDPALSFIKSEEQGGGRDLVKIRKEWHDSMVNSTLLVD